MILVIAEQRDGALNRASWEAVAAAQAIGGPIKVVVPGADVQGAAKELAAADVAEVLALQHAALGTYTPDGFVQAHATIIMEVQVQGSGVRVKRELEGGWFQWLEMPLPALLTIQSGINQLRYATLKGIMAAKKKEIRVVPAPAGLTPLVEIRSLAIPPKQKQTRLITGTAPEAAAELVRALREDARVLEGGR